MSTLAYSRTFFMLTLLFINHRKISGVPSAWITHHFGTGAPDLDKEVPWVKLIRTIDPLKEVALLLVLKSVVSECLDILIHPSRLSTVTVRDQ
jgi:hypothetical protein